MTATNLRGLRVCHLRARPALVDRGSTSTPASVRDKWDAGWAETALAIAHAPLARR